VQKREIGTKAPSTYPPAAAALCHVDYLRRWKVLLVLAAALAIGAPLASKAEYFWPKSPHRGARFDHSRFRLGSLSRAMQYRPDG